MPYVSAKYQPRDPLMLPDSPRPVQAVDDQGNVWALTEDSQVGDWLRYLAEGGTIDPVDLPVQPLPADPAPLPSEPTATPQSVVNSSGVPRAEPDITMDGDTPRLG